MHLNGYKQTIPFIKMLQLTTQVYKDYLKMVSLHFFQLKNSQVKVHILTVVAMKLMIADHFYNPALKMT